MRTSCPLVPEAPEVCSAETGKEKVSAVTRLEVTRTGASHRGGERDCWPPGPRAAGTGGKVWLGAVPGPGCRSGPAALSLTTGTRGHRY